MKNVRCRAHHTVWVETGARDAETLRGDFGEIAAAPPFAGETGLRPLHASKRLDRRRTGMSV